MVEPRYRASYAASSVTIGSVLERTVPIEGPLDLRRTLGPLHGSFDDKGWWFASRTPIGPATLHIARTGQNLHGRAWGEGAALLLDRVDSIAGLDDDPAAFRTGHPIVGELHRVNPGLRMGRTNQVFAHLIVAVVGQKVTGVEAARAMRGLRRSFSEPAPGPKPDLWLPPDPERMAQLPYWQFHELHLEKKRADTLRRAASDAVAIDCLAKTGVEVAASHLLRLPGIGAWTVAETLSRSHGDPDQVSVGDYHLKNIVVHHLTGRPKGTDHEMLELLEEFRPHRGRVVRLLHSLGHAPKFGPRMAPRQITSR